MPKLKGRTAVVLGASAEGGTGWAIAEALAAEGANVVVGARSVAPLQKLADKIGGIAVPCDGGSEADIIALRDKAVAAYGPIHIAINSAATPTLAMIAETSHEILMQGMQVNYFGMAFFVRYMTEAMPDAGSIVLISSMTTIRPHIPHFAYACGKAATECLIAYAASEYGPRGIRVNGIRISSVISDMSRTHFGTPGVGERYALEIPLGRLGQPTDIAEATIWLAGSPWISGSTLDINGGNQLNRFPFLSELPGQGSSFKDAGALYDREHGKVGWTPKA